VIASKNLVVEFISIAHITAVTPKLALAVRTLTLVDSKLQRFLRGQVSKEVGVVVFMYEGKKATANSQQPTANSQQPTANSQGPMAEPVHRSVTAASLNCCPIPRPRISRAGVSFKCDFYESTTVLIRY
jgi:hypothetical protein